MLHAVAHTRLHGFLTRHWWLTFVLMGVCFVLFGLVSLNLLHTLGASFEFLSANGIDAVRDGVLVQLAELALSGYTAAAFYVVFKLCEKVLVERLSVKSDEGADS
jgi:hypothetical protein